MLVSEVFYGPVNFQSAGACQKIAKAKNVIFKINIR